MLSPQDLVSWHWVPERASLLLGSLEVTPGEMLRSASVWPEILAQHLVIGGRERGLGPGVTPSGQWGERNPRAFVSQAARTGPVWELGTLPSPETGLFFPHRLYLCFTVLAQRTHLPQLEPGEGEAWALALRWRPGSDVSSHRRLSSGDTESTGGGKLPPHPTPFWRLRPFSSN